MEKIVSYFKTLSNIIKQVYADLFSKDVNSGFSYSYTFCADQFGHYTLGIIPSLFFMWMLNSQSYIIPLLVMLVWVVKECFDLYSVKAQDIGSDFPVDYKDLISNMCCAWIFFGIGAFTAYSTYGLNLFWPSLIPAIFGIFYAIPWIQQKIMLNKASIPNFCRLSSLTCKIDNKQLVNDLSNGVIGNFLILGNKGSGKSTVGNAIATEAIMLNGKQAIYSTFNKIMDSPDFSGADIWIIDDVCANNLISNTKMIIISEILNDNNFIFPTDKTVVWIVSDPTNQKLWETMFKSNGTIICG